MALTTLPPQIAAELAPETLTAMLVRLVRCRSVNPGTSEAEMAAACADLLQHGVGGRSGEGPSGKPSGGPSGRQSGGPQGSPGGIPLPGLSLREVEFAPGRTSLGAVIDSGRPGPRLVLNGHVDTVTVEEAGLWSVDPFAGEVRDGFVWGRGSADMKAGLVSMIACGRAFALLAAPHGADGGDGGADDRGGALHGGAGDSPEHAPRGVRGSLVLHFAAGEECGEAGTLSLLQAGLGGDLGICTEPTRLTVATAMRGVAWYHITVRGTAAHAGSRDAGRNPIDVLPRLLTALSRYDDRIGTDLHPLLGRATCTPTRVNAGIQNNSLPAELELVVDRRLLPGETPEGTMLELREVLTETLGAAAAGIGTTGPATPLAAAARPADSGLATPEVAGSEPFRWRIEPIAHPFAPAEVPADSPFVDLVRGAVADVTGAPPEVTGTPYGSDVRNLILDGHMEAVTFGPGDIDLCHRPDEHVPIDELTTAARALLEVALRV